LAQANYFSLRKSHKTLFSFVLASSKDLAVSPLMLPPRFIPEGYPIPFGFERLCSHLASCDGRLLAAAILTLKNSGVEVRTFLTTPCLKGGVQSPDLLRQLHFTSLFFSVKAYN